MSAICGVFSFDARLDTRAVAAAVLHEMQTAGPDGEMQWSGPGVTFAQRLLRATPESVHERSVRISPCGALVLVWDGRLDNRAALQLSLEEAGHSPRDASDAELVMQSYLAWQDDCPTRFLGDFAFAIWDVQRQRLFCARDHVGARPLYFVRTPSLFAFASLDEALLQVPGVAPAVDEQRVAYFLAPAYEGFDMAGSWWRDVRALGAGQSITVEAGGRVHAHTFWAPAPGEEASFTSDDDCANAFNELFEDAVRCRLRSAQDVALMLSGGLDSAAILATAEALGRGGNVQTYSAVSDNSEDCVESKSVLALARGRSAAHYLALPSCSGMLDAAEVIRTITERPSPVDHSVLLPALMCRAAGRNGHQVMLTGLCGDLAIHGSYPYINALMRRGHWREAIRESLGASRHHTFLQGNHPATLLARNAYHAFAPAAARRMVHRMRHPLEHDPLASTLIRKDFAARAGVMDWLREASVRSLAPFADLQASHLQILGPPHGIAACMGCYTRVASRWGVEVRDPWADRRVLEFWLRLPIRFRWRNGWTKYLVRHAFRGRLPAVVLSRTGKEHVGWNVVSRFMSQCGPTSAAALEDALAGVDNFVDVGAAKRVLARYLATGSYDDCLKIFDALTLSSWIRERKTSIE